jgi:hypothetical protein
MLKLKRYFWLIAIVIIILGGCSVTKSDKIGELIDKGEFGKARKLLSVKLADNPNDHESSVLLAMSYRKEYYTTWDVRKYRTPLEGEWSYFPVAEMAEIDQYRKILDILSQKGIWNIELEEEYFFLLTYDFFRMKYADDLAEAESLPLVIQLIIDKAGELADNAEFWRIYAENGYSVDFDFDKLKSLILKYPETELAGLQILQKIFREDVTSQIERLRNYNEKYPDFSVYADSLFIYRSIAGAKPKLNSTQLEFILSENVSVTINRYILLIKAERVIERGEVDAGLADLSKLINQEQDKYERDKLNLKLGKTAFREKRYGLVISSFRQLDELSVPGRKQLWESYLEKDNEEDANEVYDELKSELSSSDLKRMDKRKYKFDLSKLELSELNLVKGYGSVTIEGVVSNPTRKIYHGITVLLSLSDSKGANVKERKLVIGELYSETNEKFNEFIDYDTNIAGILYKGIITGFEIVE